MALFQDKRKPVDIYDPESATAKAQAATTDVALAPVKFVGRQLDAVTAPAQRVLNQTVVPAAAAVGNRLASDAAATTDVAQRVGLRQAIQQTPQGDMAGIRQAEAANPAPVPRLGGSAVAAPSPAPVSAPALESPIASSGAGTADQSPSFRSVGSSNVTIGPGLGVNYTPQDLQLKANMGKIDQMLASGVTPTAQQSESIAQLRRDAGFLRGGTDRRPVGPDGLPLRIGGGGGSVPGGATDSGLSVQFTKNVPDQVRREVMQPLGANDPVAQAAREKQGKQFLSRQGVEDADPVTGMTPSQERALPVKERVALAQTRIGAKTAADNTDVARLNATGAAEERKVGLKVKQNELADQEEARSLLAEMETASPARQQQIERKLVALGKKQPRAEKEPKVYFQKTYDDMGKVSGEEPFLYDEATGEARPLRLGGQKPMPTFKNRDEQKQYLINLAKTNPQEYARLKAAEAASVK
jgi:hypothetical protein